MLIQRATAAPRQTQQPGNVNVKSVDAEIEALKKITDSSAVNARWAKVDRDLMSPSTTVPYREQVEHDSQ